MSEATEPGSKVLTPPPPQAGGGNGDGLSAGDVLGRSLGIFVRQREVTVLVVTVGLLLFFGITHPTSFISQRNGVILLSEDVAPYAILAIGEVLLLICGEIDLSVGFIYTFAPFVMFFAVNDYHVPPLLGVILALLSGLLAGWINAFVTVTLKVPSFITTIGTGYILWGLALTMSHNEPQPIPPSAFGVGKLLGIPGQPWQWAPAVWTVALVLIFAVVLTRTRWGLYTVAVGGNPLAAREAGINVGRVKYGNFMITGFLGALVGLQAAFYIDSVDPSGGGYQPMFYAVIAAVIGGTAMLGGSGTIIGAFLGAMVIGTLTDGFAIMGISSDPLDIIFGGAILVAMIANVALGRLRQAGRTL